MMKGGLTLDKPTLIIGILIGIIIGMVIAGMFLIFGFSEIANNLHIQSVAVNTSVNFTIPINESRLVEEMSKRAVR